MWFGSFAVLVFSLYCASYLKLCRRSKRKLCDNADHKAEHILRTTTATLLIFICFLSLAAWWRFPRANWLQQNVSVLSYLANIHDSPLINLWHSNGSYCNHLVILCWLQTLEAWKALLKDSEKIKVTQFWTQLNTKITIPRLPVFGV